MCVWKIVPGPDWLMNTTLISQHLGSSQWGDISSNFYTTGGVCPLMDSRDYANVYVFFGFIHQKQSLLRPLSNPLVHTSTLSPAARPLNTCRMCAIAFDIVQRANLRGPRRAILKRRGHCEQVTDVRTPPHQSVLMGPDNAGGSLTCPQLWMLRIPPPHYYFSPRWLGGDVITGLCSNL